jgi:L-fuconolactonase
MVARHRNRFLPLGLIDPASPRSSTDVAALLKQGCVGFRVNLSLDLEQAEAQTAQNLWARLEDLGVPVCVRATPAHHGLVLVILRRFPSLNLIVDHLELPNPEESEDAVRRLAELAQHERCALKIAGLGRLSGSRPPYHDLWALVQAAFELFGPTRLLWGSDFPGADTGYRYIDEFESIREMPFIGDEDRRIVTEETPRRLWGEPPR